VSKLEPEQPRIELYMCGCDCHAREPFQTAARWMYRYGPEASQALCTDCMLSALSAQTFVVRTWTVDLRKLIRCQAELDELVG
jgi:hypothetical protein